MHHAYLTSNLQLFPFFPITPSLQSPRLIDIPYPTTTIPMPPTPPRSPPKRPRPQSPSASATETARLRKLSRHTYLARREAQQVARLGADIADEKALFAHENLTKRERDELAVKERLHELASERLAAAAAESQHRYHLPGATGVVEAESKDPAHDRYAQSLPPPTDQAAWESQQIRKGAVAHDAPPSSDGYDLVIDQLTFAKPDSLPGISPSTHPPSPALTDNPPDAHTRLQAERHRLPAFLHKTALLDAVRAHNVLIVESETGSGKTTQIPQFVREAGYGRVVCTQPRRVAAMSVAARVADEMGVRLGTEVGYSIRFEDCSSEDTVIKYVTDGMLLREFLSEPDLNSYGVIIVDEAHERSLGTDIVMGLVKDIARFRGDKVRVILMSATMDTRKFSRYFDDAPVFKIPGRRFDVEVFYTKAPEADYIDAACTTVLQIHASQPTGDILVFLTGQDEIELAADLLRTRVRTFGSKLGELFIAPIYASLPADQQARIFESTPEGARKVVLATNIAETSVTIPGIVYVVDPGFCKQKAYNAKSGLESLLVVPVSRAGAKQRAGRAGRTQPGKCFRLYTKWSYGNEMDEDSIPELLRTNLSQVVLLLLSLGIENLLEFDFLDAPPPQALLRSLEHLYALGALNDQGKLTRLGRRMAELPLDPMMAKALLASETYECVEEVTTICGMLSANNTIFYRPKEKKVMADAAHAAFTRGGGGDHMMLLRCYAQWRDSGFSSQWCFENFVQVRSMKRARDVIDQLESLLERVELEKSTAGVGATEKILKALTAGFFNNACRLQKNGHYRTLKNPHNVLIHPSSCMARSETRPRWLVYHELVFTSKEYMRQVYDIDGAWLHEVAPHFYKQEDVEDLSKKKMPKALGKVGNRVR